MLRAQCSFINGSPQNSLVPGLAALAAEYGQYVAGDDFKTGQTKVKSALADFLIGAGIKIEAVVSYNHLGNNDGQNVAEEPQFKSKEASKSGVIEDLVRSNPLLYAPDEWPDHTVRSSSSSFSSSASAPLSTSCRIEVQFCISRVIPFIGAHLRAVPCDAVSIQCLL